MELEPREDANRIRISDREREQVVELLGTATAEGRLTLDEYEERVMSAHSARTRGELARLTHDLPTPAAAPGPGWQTAAPAPTERLMAIFGEESRKGRWRVPARLSTWSVFGSCHIELHEAELQQPVTVIEANVIFGEVTVFVPEGTEVRLTGPAVFGAKESKMREPARPGARVVEIHSRVVFGAVTVRPPKKGWWKELLEY